MASLVSVTAPDTARLQNNLTPEETLLEYYSTGVDWYIFILTRNTIFAKKLPVIDLGKNIDNLRKALTVRSSTNFSQYSQELYSQLISPANTGIKTKKLIIVPHGLLHYLPFAALSDGRDYLIDRYSVRILPSASIMNFLKNEKQKKLRAL